MHVSDAVTFMHLLDAVIFIYILDHTQIKAQMPTLETVNNKLTQIKLFQCIQIQQHNINMKSTTSLTYANRAADRRSRPVPYFCNV